MTVSFARIDTPQRKLKRRIPFHLGWFSVWTFKHLTKILPLVGIRVFSWENYLQKSTLQIFVAEFRTFFPFIFKYDFLLLLYWTTREDCSSLAFPFRSDDSTFLSSWTKPNVMWTVTGKWSRLWPEWVIAAVAKSAEVSESEIRLHITDYVQNVEDK
jgi:hypothetical protein